MNPPDIDLALFDHKRDNQPEQFRLSWSELVEILADRHRESPCSLDPGAPRLCLRSQCPEKDGPAWTPAVYREGATRGNDGVEAVTAFVLDLDHLPGDDAVQRELDKLAVAGLRYVVHTTHSHLHDDQCLRVVVPMSRPVPAAIWRPFRTAVVAHFGFAAELDDRQDPARLYFLPSHPRDSDCWGADEHDGSVLDVDAFLERAKAAPPPLRSVPPPRATAPEVEVDFDDLVKRVTRLRRTYAGRGDAAKVGLVDAILKGQPLAVPGARDVTIHEAARTLSTTFPVHTPVEAAVEMLRRSIGAMEVQPEGLQHWLDVAAEKYERGMAERVVRDAEAKAVNDRIATGLRGLVERVSRVKAKADETPEDLEDDPDGWMSQLIVKPVKDATADPQLIPCEHNTTLLLEHLPEWAGCIRFNELTKDIEVTGGPLPPSDRHSSVLPVAVASWLHRTYGLHLKGSQTEGPLLLVARRNPYDPIYDYLTEMRHRWDGEQRNARLLIDHAEAQTTDGFGRDIERHIEDVTRKWMIGAAIRALRPGLQVDSVLVLEGETGAGKTTFFRTLAGRYYSPLKSSLDAKDTTLVAARSWIVEIGELASIRKSDRESNNNELTITTDLVRPPYGRSVEEFPRRCVFGGTTEDDDWLGSVKGVRRWWPVKVGKVDNSWIYEHRDQLWGEAAHFATRALEVLDEVGDSAKLPEHLRWWLDGEAERIAHRIAAERHDAGTVQEAVLAWWTALPVGKRPERVTVSQVIESALKLDLGKSKKSIESDVSSALKNLGFVKLPRVSVGGAKVYYWQASEELRGVAQVRPERLAPVTLLRSVVPTGTEGAA